MSSTVHNPLNDIGLNSVSVFKKALVKYVACGAIKP